MSEIYRFTAHATALDNDRDVFVQIPDGYFPARGALPLLVMHDGNEDLCRGRFDAVLDTARTQSQAPALLIAYVALHDQNERMAEYTFGTTGARGLDYEAFVADELVPALETRFHTPRTAASRGIIGASLGGLISYRIGFDRPDVFSRVGGQSSSFFWNSNEMITDIQNAPMEGGRWYLDAGVRRRQRRRRVDDEGRPRLEGLRERLRARSERTARLVVLGAAPPRRRLVPLCELVARASGGELREELLPRLNRDRLDEALDGLHVRHHRLQHARHPRRLQRAARQRLSKNFVLPETIACEFFSPGSQSIFIPTPDSATNEGADASASESFASSP